MDKTTDSASRLNISRWALEHPALTRYLMLVLIVLGKTEVKAGYQAVARQGQY